MKGISPLIATILVIAMTMTIAGAVVPWAIQFSKTQTTAVGATAEKKINCIEAGVYLNSADVSYNFSGAADTMNFTVKNSGLVNLYDFKIGVKVGGTWKWYNPTTSTMVNSSNPLIPQQTATLNASITDDLASNPSKVRIIAQNCNIATEVDL